MSNNNNNNNNSAILSTAATTRGTTTIMTKTALFFFFIGGMTSYSYYIYVKKKINNNNSNSTISSTTIPKIDITNKSVLREIEKKKKLKIKQTQEKHYKQITDNNNNNNNNKKKKKKNNNKDIALPDGQVLVKKWIVLDLGIKLSLDDYNPWKEKEEDFKIKIKFFKNNELFITDHENDDSKNKTTKDEDQGNNGCDDYDEYMEISLKDIMTIDTIKTYSNISWHCVTGWSCQSLTFTGISLKSLINYIKPNDSWKCLYQISADGYTTNVHRDDIMMEEKENKHNNININNDDDDDVEEECFIALGDENGNILSYEHGGIRLIFPNLYGWKSAKYLKELHFYDYHKKGFWELFGCHSRGRIKYNERWDNKPRAEIIWNFLTFLASIWIKILPTCIWDPVFSFASNCLAYFTLLQKEKKKGNEMK